MTTTAHAHGGGAQTQAPRSRTDLFRVAPGICTATTASRPAASDGPDPVVAHLVKVRASRMNDRAFCLDVHLTHARKAGGTQLRLDPLPARAVPAGLATERGKL
jgi:AhpD family alkylhydroperoxidase